ncbi:hypothetical protein GPDM_15714 [Planococcus donghaensis MPA1U2]|uniref:Uncharacterized protein n=1 Tax=Planococcus donghaensis MPA1U2 TaxID=933115 RepID=E7RKU4_9BACL|nr:hypothetical protein [Planococcus donghaensis]EGA88380.1 hypothetical protein GPDM_15714 [Planococcus donghaensis MPA1U2]
MERKVLDPQEVERRLDEDFNAILNMIGEGSPDFAADEENEMLKERRREEVKAKDLH